MESQSGPEVFPIARGPSSALWFTAAVVGIAVVLPLLLLLIPLWPDRTEFEVSGTGLRITGSLYGRQIPLADLGESRRLTPDDVAGYRPSARTNGIGLPNYQAGWFRLGNGSKALVFLTDPSRSVIVSTTQGYTLLASPEDPDGFLAAVATVRAGERSGEYPPQRRFPLAQAVMSRSALLGYLAIASLVPVFLGALLIGLTWVSRRIRFEVSSEGLRIRGPYGRMIPRESMDLKGTRRVDPKSDPTYRVSWRTNGIGMPGYASGWFRLKGGASALLFVTDRARTVAIPTSLGYTLLLSPADPDALIQSLRDW